MALVVLIAVWIVMNILLRNLLIAIMGNTYADVSAKAEKQFEMDFYGVVDEYARRHIAAPMPLNVLLILKDVVYLIYKYQALTRVPLLSGCRGTRKQRQQQRIGQPRALYQDLTWSHKMDLFFSRNQQINDINHRHICREHFRCMGNAHFDPDSDKEYKKLKDKQLAQALEQEMDLENLWQARLNAFTERARLDFLQREAAATLALFNVNENLATPSAEGFEDEVEKEEEEKEPESSKGRNRAVPGSPKSTQLPPDAPAAPQSSNFGDARHSGHFGAPGTIFASPPPQHAASPRSLQVQRAVPLVFRPPPSPGMPAAPGSLGMPAAPGSLDAMLGPIQKLLHADLHQNPSPSSGGADLIM